MSIKLVSKCWDIQGLTTTQKLVLISLADQANDQGSCWPSIETIAKRTGISPRSTQRIISELEEIKLLHRVERAGRSNIFQLHTHVIHDTPDTDDTPVTHDVPPTTPMTGGGDTHDTQNRKEPSLKRKGMFKPPTLGEVTARAVEMNYMGFDTHQFVNYYESNGWKVGRNKMKCWKSAMATWHSRNKKDKAEKREVHL